MLIHLISIQFVWAFFWYILVQKEKKQIPIPNDGNEELSGPEGSQLREDDTPMIYMCATMWHESEIEMVQILKSIFR